MANDRTKRPKGKRGALVGFDGNNRRRLQGKEPTPRAEDRVYHSAHKRKLAAGAVRREQARLEEADRLRPELGLAPGHELVAECNAVLKAVRSGIPLSHIFVSGGVASDERLGEVIRTATALGTPLFEASRTELDRMTDGAVHQGVAIEIPPYEYADVGDLAEWAGKGTHAGKPELVVALDSVTDSYNFSAVMHSASAFDTDDVVVPERRSADMNATVWKISAGTTTRVPTARVPNLVAALSKLKTHGYSIIGPGRCGDTAIEGILFADAPIVLVTGSKGRGFARLTRETCDAIVSVPITAELESLNVAVAIGVALYQIDHLQARSQQEEQWLLGVQSAAAFCGSIPHSCR